LGFAVTGGAEKPSLRAMAGIWDCTVMQETSNIRAVKTVRMM
jgi:hypothetical protein